MYAGGFLIGTEREVIFVPEKGSQATKSAMPSTKYPFVNAKLIQILFYSMQETLQVLYPMGMELRWIHPAIT